ncbi:MAG TPA: DUF2892 domain-containing protein [Bacteroidota bacterium]|nr:DUF2892 domain-containing protein [Bacteroidota bacterium]
MEKNVGTLDRAIRVSVALVIAGLYFTGAISGTLALVLGIVAVVLIATSFLGRCPLYCPLKLSTLKKSDTQP